jgi:hypothetical protein
LFGSQRADGVSIKYLKRSITNAQLNPETTPSIDRGSNESASAKR